jgi:hypothetical protein
MPEDFSMGKWGRNPSPTVIMHLCFIVPVGRFLIFRRVANWYAGERDNMLGKGEQIAEPRNPLFAGIHAKPDRAKSFVLYGDEHVFHCR